MPVRAQASELHDLAPHTLVLGVVVVEVERTREELEETVVVHAPCDSAPYRARASPATLLAMADL